MVSRQNIILRANIRIIVSLKKKNHSPVLKQTVPGDCFMQSKPETKVSTNKSTMNEKLLG